MEEVADVALPALFGAGLLWPSSVCGTELGYAATRRSTPRSLLRSSAAISLRACYAIPGTDIAYADISLRACYAMPSAGVWRMELATCARFRH
eukprot:3141394-Rhodomonas_salina.3